MLSRFVSRAAFQFVFTRSKIPHRYQSSISNSGPQVPDDNESFLHNGDTAQAIADEEAAESIEQATSNRAEMISQAMKNYLTKSREKQKVLDEKIHEYEVGRRHLARIMGEDPESFSQEKIDDALNYLLPSGLLDERARPKMRPPEEMYPKEKAVQFDKAGRPYHFLYYTAKQNYYDALHTIANKFEELRKAEVTLIASGREPEYSLNDEFNYTQWEKKENFEQQFLEKLDDEQFKTLIICLNRLVKHPLAYTMKDYISSFRTKLSDSISKQQIEPLRYDIDGRPYQTASAKHKWCTATVTLREGTGKVTIKSPTVKTNVHDILYFTRIMHRDQLLYPFKVIDRVNLFDIDVSYDGIGFTAQAIATRLAVSKALCSFISSKEVEYLRLAGLLTDDARRKERKQPGKRNARRKYKFRKR
ncbi:hypothetical protein I4U23_006230 [Adineta vaga]|nr:hypothetical protein I4U23_006230 [Adineta vaga]